MSKNFFVMLNRPAPGLYLPMMYGDLEVAFYETEEAARADAEKNRLGKACGYEIFEIGRDSQ